MATDSKRLQGEVIEFPDQRSLGEVEALLSQFIQALIQEEKKSERKVLE